MQTRALLYDVTLTIHPGMVVWPGNSEVVMESHRGPRSTVSNLSLGVHTGTHVDAPSHFLPEGESVETLPPEILVGPVRLFHLDTQDAIGVEHLEGLDWSGVTRALFRTANSQYWAQGETAFQEHYAHLSPEAAQWLVDQGIRLVGVDYLSVGGRGEIGARTHKILLEARVVIVEGLDLSRVPAGDYRLICAPLKIKGSDGSPARVFLEALPPAS